MTDQSVLERNDRCLKRILHERYRTRIDFFAPVDGSFAGQFDGELIFFVVNRNRIFFLKFRKFLLNDHSFYVEATVRNSDPVYKRVSNRLLQSTISFFFFTTIDISFVACFSANRFSNLATIPIRRIDFFNENRHP